MVTHATRLFSALLIRHVSLASLDPNAVSQNNTSYLMRRDLDTNIQRKKVTALVFPRSKSRLKVITPFLRKVFCISATLWTKWTEQA